MEKQRIGFIGFGEAAFNIAKGLKEEEGFSQIMAYDKNATTPPFSDLIGSRVSEADVLLCKSLEELIENAEFVFCAVSADMVVKIAEEARHYLKRDKVYVDINAGSPKAKSRLVKL